MVEITNTIWTRGVPLEPQSSPLSQSIDTDVVIIGAGITGITTAYLLAKQNKRVVVIDRGTIGWGETSRTSAMITEVFDFYASELEKIHGKDHAWLAWSAGHDAKSLIKNIVTSEKITCDFEEVPAFIFSPDAPGRAVLEKEMEKMQQFKQQAILLEKAHLPFAHTAVLQVPGQAIFHPLKYLTQLANICKKMGVQIFEGTVAESIEQNRRHCVVKTPKGTVTATDIVHATHYPYTRDVKVLSRLSCYNTYMLEVPIEKNIFPQGMYWDTQDPYFYFRTVEEAEKTYLIVGGADHRTGEMSKENPYETIESYLREQLHVKTAITRMWCGQVIETGDMLPFIGRYKDHIYMATGFSGTGMTYGSLSGKIISDLILGKQNKFEKLLSFSRFKNPIGMAKEGMHVTKGLIIDRAASLFTKNKNPLKDSGIVISENGKPVALYKSIDGKLHKFSAECTHMGCQIAWNDADKTWDCPCHGSRFAKTGDVITGPAHKHLKKI